MRRLINFFAGVPSGPIILGGDAIGPPGSNTVVGWNGQSVVGLAGAVAGQIPVFNGTVWLPGAGGGGSASKSMYFWTWNGDASSYPTMQPIDCQKRMLPGVATDTDFRHRTDSTGAGAGGSTTVIAYKRTSPVARVPFATATIPQGAGDNAVVAGTFVGVLADRTFAAGDAVEVEATSYMSAGATTQEQDVIFSLQTLNA